MVNVIGAEIDDELSPAQIAEIEARKAEARALRESQPLVRATLRSDEPWVNGVQKAPSGWRASAGINGSTKHLGTFPTEAEARAAVGRARKEREAKAEATPKSSVPGVYFKKQSGKWDVLLSVGGKLKFFGTFAEQEAAEEKVRQVRRDHPAWATDKEGAKPKQETPEPMSKSNGLGEFSALKARINGESPAPKPLEQRLTERLDRAAEAEKPEPKRRGPKPGSKRQPRPETADATPAAATLEAEKPANGVAASRNIIPTEPQVFERLHDELTAAAEVVEHLRGLPLQSARNVLRLVLDRLGGDSDAAY